MVLISLSQKDLSRIGLNLSLIGRYSIIRVWFINWAWNLKNWLSLITFWPTQRWIVDLSIVSKDLFGLIKLIFSFLNMLGVYAYRSFETLIERKLRRRFSTSCWIWVLPSIVSFSTWLSTDACDAFWNCYWSNFWLCLVFIFLNRAISGTSESKKTASVSINFVLNVLIVDWRAICHNNRLLNMKFLMLDTSNWL